MSAKDFLKEVGAVVSRDFLQNRSILSFEEYLELFLQGPHAQVRNAAQYLRDVLDHFGTEQVAHPAGKMRRFKLFDRHRRRARRAAWPARRKCRTRSTACSATSCAPGRINKLILLHGPNGSAKSTMVDALKRGMEHYSPRARGRAVQASTGSSRRRSWSRAASASATRCRRAAS